MIIDRFNFTDMTLHEALGMIIPDDVKLPKDKRIARLMFFAIMKKFDSCTEAERRDTTRSDAEFMLIVKETIMKRCGFKNEIDAYGEDFIEIPEIPIIKRGNELFWHPDADPEERPQGPDAEIIDEVGEKLKAINSIIFRAVSEYYPNEYSKTFAIMRRADLCLNLDQKETIKQLKDTRKDFVEFTKVALPLMAKAAVDYMADHCSMKPKEVKEMYSTITPQS